MAFTLISILLVVSFSLGDVSCTSIPLMSPLVSLSADDNPIDSQAENGRILFYVGFAVGALNFISSSYVIFGTYKRWKRSNKSLSLKARFPFYIATTGKHLSMPSLSLPFPVKNISSQFRYVSCDRLHH